MTDWAGAYGGSGSSGGGGTNWASHYGGGFGGARATAPKPSGGGHSLFGGNFFGLTGLASNLGSDAYHAVTDFPAGLYHMGQGVVHGLTTQESLSHAWNDPKDIAGMIHAFLRSERSTYGPVLHGNFHRLYEHPLTPILDLATIASLGGGAALKAGRIGALGPRAQELATSDRLLSSGNLTERLTPARTLQGRARQQAYDRFSMANPNAPLIGANRRLANIATVRAFRKSMADAIPARRFQSIISPLSVHEQRALHIGAEQMPLDERIAYFRSLPQTRLIQRYVKAIDHPKVRAALENPTPRMVGAVNAGRDLEAQAGQRLIDTGQLTPEIRAERALLPQRIMRPGVEPSAENLAYPHFGPAFRFPHASAETQPGLYVAPKGAPLGKVKELGQLKKNQGKRLQAAAFGTMPEQLVRDYLQTHRERQLLTMQHDVMEKVASEVTHDLPGGKHPNEHYFRPSYQRATTTPIPRAVREEQALHQDLISPLDRANQLQHHAGESVFTEKNAPADVREAIQSNDIERLKALGVKRVPAAFGKKYTSSFAGTSGTTRLFIDRPLDVWRAITLNFRPAWMVNNLVGNNLMYFLRHPSGAGAYLRALLATERGEDKVRQIMRWTFKQPTLRRKYERVFSEVAPEIQGAGLYGTQTKLTHAGVYRPLLDHSTALRAAKTLALPVRAVTVPLRAFGRGVTFLERHLAEDAPREAAMLKTLDPLVNKLKQAGMTTEQALKSLDPRDVELAVNDTLDALGDFNALSATERRVVRRFIPFWSWYRVITTVSAKFAARYPARVLLINAIAQQARAEDKALPSWLQGEIQLGPAKGGVQPVLTTAGLNPYQTLTQLATQNPSGLLNPFIQGGEVGATGVDPFTGGTYHGWGAQSTGSPLADFFKRGLGAFAYGSVPGRLSTQLTGTAGASKIYKPKTYGHAGPVPINDAVLQYLGLPIRHVRVAQAKVDKRKGY